MVEDRRAQSPEKHGVGRKALQVLKTVQARLRFFVLLAVVGGVILYWDRINAVYEKWTRPFAAAQETADADGEYWCPMHPTVVRDHPDKCPICGMPLSKRKKSADKGEALPPGVISRLQLTPYRVALAGVRTAAVEYRPLIKQIDAAGFVEFDETKLTRITNHISGRSRIDKLYVNVTDQTIAEGDALALLYSPDLDATMQNLLDAHRGGNKGLEQMTRQRLQLWGIGGDQVDEAVKTGKPITQVTIRSPVGGHVLRKYQLEGDYIEEGARLFDVADLSTVWVEAQVFEDELAFLKNGLTAHAYPTAYPNREFTGTLAQIHPHLDAETRTLKVRFDLDNPGHVLRPGMYAAVKLDVPAAGPDASPGGSEVLAVPESAVIDTGGRKVVYREAGPSLYDGVEVELGPRCGDYYPVVKGLTAGDRVATAGAFLIDAETRLTGLNAAHAAGEPGTGPSPASEEDAEVHEAMKQLSPDDRKVAEEQGLCPILKTRLGTMGAPVKVVLKGRPVFLCCPKCVDRAKADEQRTLDKLRRLPGGDR